ncbi:hypothetical protein ACFX2J_017621 [Malus domestica]
MAQAARLNLRLQKELKLLLTDPPPGASFPLLASSSSLTTIDAQIKGPEGTVYAEGFFNIKIQIPERYPFQPPSVTFATRIYHPNIDTGGRICLDILNLPPKGAWQPSLNISTVLTSIGLLLSEPNPDDGLMREASREFKYNRQAFDQKARSMTQKYAQSSASGSVCDSQSQPQSSANPLTVLLEVKASIHESKHEAEESAVSSHKKVIGGSRKLSLESSGQTQKRDVCGKGNEVPKVQLFASDFGNKMEVKGTEKLLEDKCSQSQEKICGSRRKLSLEALSQPEKKSDGMENVVANHRSSLKLQNLPVPSSGSVALQSGNSYKQGLHQSQDSKLIDDNTGVRSKRLRQFENKQSLASLNTSQIFDENNDKKFITPQLPPSVSHSDALSEPLSAAPALDSINSQPHKDLIDGMGNGSVGISCKKLCLAGKKLSLGSRGSSEAHGKANKENVAPKLTENHTECEMAHLQENNNNNTLPQPRSISSYPSKALPEQQQNLKRDEKQQSDEDYNCGIAAGINKQKEGKKLAMCEAEAVIVLDSESSDEERSRPAMTLSVLARKRMGKWRPWSRLQLEKPEVQSQRPEEEEAAENRREVMAMATSCLSTLSCVSPSCSWSNWRRKHSSLSLVSSSSPASALSFESRQHRRSQVVCMAPDEEKLTRRNPLDFPIEWERPKPGRRPDIFPQFSPMKTPLPPPMPYDPPEEDEDEEEKKEEEEEEQEQEEESPEKIDPDKNNI